MNIPPRIETEVFLYEDYKPFLRDLIENQPKGYATRLAEAAGCQRSYLSDVMRGSIQLTPDHAYGIARFLGLQARREDYFLKLVQYARAASKAYRERLASQLRSDRLEFQRLSTRLDSSSTQRREGIADYYYASWHYAAIHIATSIADLRTVGAIAERLRLPEAVVESVLQFLVTEGYVLRKQRSYHYNEAKPAAHLPDSSALSRLNHANWRNLSLSRAFDAGEVHYSSVFAVAKKDLAEIRLQLLNFIEEQRRSIEQSGSEELALFCCDFQRLP